MEGVILNVLKWNLCYTSAYVFLEKVARVECSDLKTLNLARYFIEECLICYEMSKHGQHILACSCLYLANKFRKIHPSWTQK